MDYYTQFDDDYRQLLSDIASNFEENLIRVIGNDIERTLRRNKPPIHFENVGFSAKGIQIRLENIKLVTQPTFNLDNLKVDFSNLLLDVGFSLNDLEFIADYDLVTPVIGMEINQQGSMKFLLKQITTTGKIGMFITEDSFMPVNYDLSYNIGEIKIETANFVPDGEPCEHGAYNLKQILDVAVGTSIDTTIISMFWPQVERYFDDFMHRLVAGNVVEYSVTELLIDEPEHLKGYQTPRTKLANDVFDECLRGLKEEYTRHATLNVTEPFTVTTKCGNEKCKVETAPGKLQNMITLERISDTSLFQSEDEAVYCAHASLHDFTYVLDCCKINCTTNLLEGIIMLTPHRNKIFIKIVVPKSGPKTINAKFVDIGKLDVQNELNQQDGEIFTCVIEKLLPYFIGHLQHYSNSVLQKIVQNFNRNSH